MSRGVMRRIKDVKDQLRSDIDYGKLYRLNGEWKYKTQRWRKVPEEVGYLLDHYEKTEEIHVDTDGKVHWSPK